jgi:hypothetical protein
MGEIASNKAPAKGLLLLPVSVTKIILITLALPLARCSGGGIINTSKGKRERANNERIF